MTWGWQQPYDAALREKDPRRLAERLVIAEKVIVQRLQELPGPAHGLPEGRALREALDRLYAMYPHERHPPGQIQGEETDPVRRNWMRLALPVGLGLMLASATAWVAARRNDLSEARRMAAAAETQARRNSRTTIIPGAGDNPVIGAASHEHGSPGAAQSARGPNSITQNRMNGQRTDAQSKNPNISLEAPAGHGGSSVATPLTNAPETVPKASGNVANTPEAQVESARPRDSVDDSAVTAGRDSANHADVESRSSSASAAEPQDKLERPRGTVSVSASTYPSIRVPLQLRSEKSASAESLQIGESILRTGPAYPEEAQRQRVEGTVRLRAIVGKDGAVENVEVMSGPPLLAAAAVSAVRQWRYKPTLLGDRAIEVAEDVTIVFRLANATAAAN
jgi:TonB family protein